MDGFCLVISPLIALMQDQVSRLKKLDIPAECIHSGMHFYDVRRVLDNTVNSAYKLLYISPERLQTQLFRDYMTEFDVSMIAVDEAHCISQWGHDFRPDYLKIASVRDVYPSAPILALTATATPLVKEDIALQLKFRKNELFQQSFARNNIYYDIKYSENKNGDTISRLNSDCSIIYCRSRKLTETLGKLLQQSGISSAIYHAGLPREKREEAQEKWMSNRSSAMVATTAFGMGIDKPDVRKVIHYDAPEHLEAYYQEAGRAGRDGKPSFAFGLYNNADIKRLLESIKIQFPEETYLRQVYQAVVEYLQIPIGTEPDRYYTFDLIDFCGKFNLLVSHAIYALKLLEQEGLWSLTESVYSPATIHMLADRHTLDDLRSTNPTLAHVTLGLLRMYNTLFHFPTPIRETAIAKQIKIEKEHLISCLVTLEKMGILEYNRPGEGPQLFFHHYRVDSRHLLIDLNRINVLRKRHIARTEAMISFLENTTECRERILLNYFGENPTQDCGHCDVCAKNKTVKIDILKLTEEILATLKTKGKSSIRELVLSFPPSYKDHITEIIRSLADDKLLKTEIDGTISL